MHKINSTDKLTLKTNETVNKPQKECLQNILLALFFQNPYYLTAVGCFNWKLRRNFELITFKLHLISTFLFKTLPRSLNYYCTQFIISYSFFLVESWPFSIVKNAQKRRCLIERNSIRRLLHIALSAWVIFSAIFCIRKELFFFWIGSSEGRGVFLKCTGRLWAVFF